MTTPALLPCPFCGGTALLRDSSGSGIFFVECDSCDARGPCVEVERVAYPESMFTTISTTPNGDTVEPPLRVVGGFNDEYWKLKRQATQKAEAAAAAAWNQRSAWQPIETAPRDGTEVFVWDGAKAVVAVSEHDFFGDVIHWPIDEWGDKRRDQPPVDGIHWQPLPSPPPITLGT